MKKTTYQGISATLIPNLVEIQAMRTQIAAAKTKPEQAQLFGQILKKFGCTQVPNDLTATRRLINVLLSRSTRLFYIEKIGIKADTEIQKPFPGKVLLIRSDLILVVKKEGGGKQQCGPEGVEVA